MTEASHGHELIIIKRHEDEEHEHHSSAWKVAHADFMTAMMAFFLIMWLINVTDDQVRKGISEYFNPIHMSQGSSDLKGLNKPEPGEGDKASAKGHSDIPLPGSAMNLLELSAGHSDSKSVSPEQAAAAMQAAAEAAAKMGEAAKAAGEGDKSGAAEEGAAKGQGADGAAEGAATVDEHGAFADPYAVLAKIAEEYAAQKANAAAIAGDTRAAGREGGAVDRDPFDPSYWQTAPLPEARATNPGPAGTAQEVPGGAVPDAAAVTAEPGTAVADIANNPAAVAPADGAVPETPPAGKAAAEAASKALAADIERSVTRLMPAGASPDLAVAATAEGISVSLTDDARYSMFPVGSAVPDAKTVLLLGDIAKVLSARPGQIVIRGYTDARPFHSADYDNWRLSAARAHMAYYMLTRGGLPEARVDAIEGHADRALKNPVEPFAAENRRIEILLKEKAQ